MSKILLPFYVFLCCYFPGIATEPIYFQGTITYVATASGSDSDGVALFNSFAATETTCYWSENTFRQDETGGLNDALAAVINNETYKHFVLYKEENEYENAEISNIDEVGEDTKKLLPQMFSYKLDDMHETAEILGYKTKKYELSESGFLKTGAKCYIWITDELTLKPSRYDIETDWKRILPAYPLNFLVDDGAILKTITIEGEVIVEYLVTKIDPSPVPDSYFILPEGAVLKKED